jgi:Family of unknown function (DUF6132)
MIPVLKKHWLTLTGCAIGAIGGYLYWLNIGCSSGSCMITSNPVNATLYGTIMGGLLLTIFKKENKK